MMQNAHYQNDSLKAMVVWSEPIPYDEFARGEIDFPEFDPYEIALSEETDDFYVNKPIGDKVDNFYMILGEWGNTVSKLFYMGKTKQSIYKRVTSADHVEKRNCMHRDYPKHKLLISSGTFYMGDFRNKTKNRINDIESLLIYANYNEKHTYNEKNAWNHKVDSDFWIKNCGCYEPLKKELYYGLIVTH